MKVGRQWAGKILEMNWGYYLLKDLFRHADRALFLIHAGFQVSEAL